MVEQEGTLGLDEETLNRRVDIAYYGTEETLGVFADQAMVSHSTGMFTLYFFQMQFPPTPTAEELRTLQAIPARCVSRIILSPTLMKQFAKAINVNLERYENRVPAAAEPVAEPKE